MKQINNLLFIILFFPLSQNIYSQTNTLSVTFRLRNSLYREIQATRNQTDAHPPDNSNNARRYRYFNYNNNYNAILMSFQTRQNKVWRDFKNATPIVSQQTKENFIRYFRENDPDGFGLSKVLAPKLEFTFIGINAQYILTSIEVKTIQFQGYAGGAFSDNEAWYDIELRHTPGKRTYNIDQERLRFTTSGVATLRFGSDNYLPSAGMTLPGCYLINIKFNFQVNGTNVSVETGDFKIDI